MEQSKKYFSLKIHLNVTMKDNGIDFFFLALQVILKRESPATLLREKRHP